jgi:hypothetical protein
MVHHFFTIPAPFGVCMRGRWESTSMPWRPSSTTKGTPVSLRGGSPTRRATGPLSGGGQVAGVPEPSVIGETYAGWTWGSRQRTAFTRKCLGLSSSRHPVIVRDPG